ncbi:hypothetical protein E8E12_009332 [Didymella heteroderae]|uniref:Beta-lactamase-related domain-containing protein n=1 Tax=Didymella heteroderae TaxID=1769908 RepID=A0A9P4WTB7_9PLEO|nr:hypothetical protein E8E12_009332 [Didymella heteroderae]
MVEGFGYSNIESGVRNTPWTLFYGASTTKAFTAAAFAKLIEDRTEAASLSWQTKLRDIDPENFHLADQNLTNNVTIEDALSHCSGMPSHDNSSLVEFRYKEETPKSYLRRLASLPVGDLSKGRHLYTNFMLEEILRRSIWIKLGMHQTSFEPHSTPWQSSDLATGYTWSEIFQSYLPLPSRDYSCQEGASAVVSNVVDYTKWIHCLIHQRGPLSKASHRELITVRAHKKSKSWKGVSRQGYALGWSTLRYKEHDVLYHTGTLPGYSCLVIFCPSLKWGTVAFSNSHHRGLGVSSVICWGLLDDILGAPYEAKSYWERHAERKMRIARNRESIHMVIPPSFRERAPFSAGFEDYLGHYSHPAYGTYHIRSRGGVLLIEAMDLPCRSVFVFEHIDRDDFLLRQHKVDWDTMDVFRARFHVKNCKVLKLGIAFKEAMMDEMIYFTKRLPA